MTLQIRLANENDAEQIQAIYAPFVRDTPISFETEVPTVKEIEERIHHYLERYPYLVCDDDGTIAGYAYASLHRARPAYQWSTESSVYTHPDYRKRGIGRLLYSTLFNIVREQGFYNVFAGITQPNSASVGFHEALGFEYLGVFKNIGYKFGAWHDVAWYALTLQEHAENPTAPIALPDFSPERLAELLSLVTNLG